MTQYLFVYYNHMKNRISITESEKNRILGLHSDPSLKRKLFEQSEAPETAEVPVTATPETLKPRTKDEFMKVYNMGQNYPASFENGYFKVDDTQLNAPDKDDFEIKDGSTGNIYHDSNKVYFKANPSFEGHKPIAIVLF